MCGMHSPSHDVQNLTQDQHKLKQLIEGGLGQNHRIHQGLGFNVQVLGFRVFMKAKLAASQELHECALQMLNIMALTPRSGPVQQLIVLTCTAKLHLLYMFLVENFRMKNVISNSGHLITIQFSWGGRQIQFKSLDYEKCKRLYMKKKLSKL